jgi:hypothetical protein
MALRQGNLTFFLSWNNSKWQMSAKFCDLMSAQILDTLFIVCSVQTENKAGAYPRVEHMKAAKIRLDWKGLSGGAHERCTLD